MKKPVAKRAGNASTRTPRKAASKAAVGKGTGPRAGAASASSRGEAPPHPAKNILTAGIKALTHAHEEAVARQSRVFESLLGLGPKRPAEATEAQAPSGATTLDPFGFRKFEDVFDQRVARAMQNLQVPTAQAFAELAAEVDRLRETVARLEAEAQR